MDEWRSTASSDLDRSLAFVIRKIDEAAAKAGQAVDAEARDLLLNLPTEPIHPPPFLEEEGPPPPRDLAYERLCVLARAAYAEDSKYNPTPWKFAEAVFHLNRHPMRWLLTWAGVKQERLWWDGCAVTVAALLLILSLLGIGMSYSHVQHNAPNLVLWAGGVCIYLGLAICAGIAWNKFQQKLLERRIEKYRFLLDAQILRSSH